MNIDKTKPVMLTGATGYVAGPIVKMLLEDGITVHATVRDPDNKEKLKYLDEIAAKSKGTIKYYKADLLTPGAYKEAIQGCEVVFHTASPFVLAVKDAKKELIEPAQQGTRNVLEEVNRTESVKRVVLTSSCAAIYGDNIDLENTGKNEFTEEHWNSSSSLEHQPYSYSKMLAEKEAWKICEEQNRWDLIVVNPSLVVGPGINPYGTSESFNLIQQFGDGTMKSGVPNWGMGVVDVRDLADAHVKAAYTPSAKGRHIISGHNASFPIIAKHLRDSFGKTHPIPKKTLPKWLVWLVGPIVNKGMTRKMVSRNIGLPWRANNKKSIEELGVSYRPLDVSLTEFFQQMIEAGSIKPNGKK